MSPDPQAGAVLILMKPGGRLSMKGLKTLLVIVAGCLMAASLHADIYEWTDENGVKHFTNYAPPVDTVILMKSEELPYDQTDDRTAIEAERQLQLELVKLELARKEAELKRREAEAQRRVAEAERHAEETVRSADRYLDDAGNDRYGCRSGGYYGNYVCPLYRHPLFRNHTAGICFVKPPYIDPYKPKYRGKNHYGHSRKNFGNKYHPQKHASPQIYKSPKSLRSRGRTAHDAYRVKFSIRGQWERSHPKMASYGFPR
jgi:hypothetical protein